VFPIFDETVAITTTTKPIGTLKQFIIYSWALIENLWCLVVKGLLDGEMK
jgi:hypothetical protein